MTKNQMGNLENREAKGIVLEKITRVSEAEKNELFEKYRSDVPSDLMGKYHHAIAVGTWGNRAVKALTRGATEDEIHRMVRVIWVAIEAPRKSLDLARAIHEEGMDDIMVKYIRPSLIEERKQRDQQRQLDYAAKMKTVLEMHERGIGNARIAKILDIPESTVRFFVAHKSVAAMDDSE